MNHEELPPQFQEPKRQEAPLYEELPAEVLPEPPPPAEEPPRAPEPFLRRG